MSSQSEREKSGEGTLRALRPFANKHAPLMASIQLTIPTVASRLKALAKFLPIYFNAAICCMHFAYHRRFFGFFLFCEFCFCLTFALTFARCREDLLSFAFLPSYTLLHLSVCLYLVSLSPCHLPQPKLSFCCCCFCCCQTSKFAWNFLIFSAPLRRAIRSSARCRTRLSLCSSSALTTS